MSILRRWHETIFADFQTAEKECRTDWYAWADTQPGALDLGCGWMTCPGAIGCDVAFGDVKADALRLPFASESFGEILTSHLVEHVEPIGLITECSRVLCQGGRLLIEGPNLCGTGRALRVWQAGARDARYPLGSATRAGAIIRGLLAWRFAGRVVEREPCLDVSYPGKDPDAVWWCNSFAVLRMLRCEGFRIGRTSGLFSYTFRIEAYA